MSVFLQPLQTITVGAGGASSVTFSSISQNYTDLQILISARSTKTSSATDSLLININGSSSNMSSTYLQGSGSSSSSNRSSSLTFAGELSDNSATSNTFGVSTIYIPNYTSSNYKSFIQESVAENNATVSAQSLWANLWSNTAAINSLQFYFYAGNLVQYSILSLYGVLRQGI
jgi:hypothetical protein